MAISTSKKSLGKILAISLASAMAMSSLSAALVSVSAVQDPALASNGSVDFTDNTVEKEITDFFNGMSDINDDVVDVMAGKKLSLNDLADKLEAPDKFTYTDSDGLEVKLTGTECEFKVTSGTSYLKYYNKDDTTNKYDAGDLVAQADKSGSATLQIKVTGYANIGAGRDDKKVSMTQNIKFKVHKENEIDLEAYNVAKADEVNFDKRPLTDADLNDLAAYGADITFCVVKYTSASPTSFFATISPAKGAPSYDPGQNADEQDQKTYVETEVQKHLEEKLGTLLSDSTNVSKAKTEIMAGLTFDETAGTYTLNWDAIKDKEVQGTVAAGDAFYQKNTPAVTKALAEQTATAVKDGKAFTTADGKTYVTGDSGVKPIKANENDTKAVYEISQSPVKLLVPVASGKARAAAVTEPTLVTEEGSGRKLTVNTDTGVAKLVQDTYVAAKAENADKALKDAWADIEQADDEGFYYTGKDSTYDAATIKVTVPSGKKYTNDHADVKTALTSALGTTFKAGTPAYAKSGTTELVLVDFGTTVLTEAEAKAFSVIPNTNGTNATKTVYTTTNAVKNYLVGEDKDQNPTYTEIKTLATGYQLDWGDDATEASGDVKAAAQTAVDNELKKSDTKLVAVTVDNQGKKETSYYYTGEKNTLSTWLDSIQAAIGTNDASANVFKQHDTQTDAVQLNMDDKTAPAVIEDETKLKIGYTLTFDETVDIPGEEKSAFTKVEAAAAATQLTKTQPTDQYHVVDKTKEQVVTVYELEFQPGIKDNTTSYEPQTVKDVITEEELNQIIKEARNAESGEGEGDTPVKAAFVLGGTESITGIRFYAGSGQDLFKVTDTKGGDWVRGTKGGTTGLNRLDEGRITLSTKGDVGSGSIKVAVGHGTETDELVLNVKTVKAVDFNGASSINIDKSGSKTLVDDGSNKIVNNENINGFEIRNVKSVTIENGTVGCIKDAETIAISGGKAASIDSEDASVTITEDGIVGDIVNAKSVIIDEGGQAGNITADANVSLTEGTVASIDVDGTVEIKGGTVNGNVTATKNIDISSNEDDTNDDPLDTKIDGNVTLLAAGADARIMINNESDEGLAKLSILGNIVAKHVDTRGNDATITIGDSNTTGLIEIEGSVEGEVIQLGGNGLVSLAGVRAANEIERNDDDAEKIESTIIFDGFNSAIAAINNFADVKVTEGTVIVKGAVSATNLTVNSDAQIVADSITVEEDIMEGGSIVVPVGKLTVTGSVDDSPSLALTGELTEGAVAFIGNRGLADKFETGGLTLKAEKLQNGNYNYLISKIELNGLTAIGKDVAIGVKQEKNVSVALDGTLPEGASIVWESDDADIATVVGNGASAVITGEDVGTTTVTAKIVDANGRELGYEDASFDVNVLDNATVDSIGGDIGPDDNQVDLDTKKKNMAAGQVYTFMVRGNNDVDNLSVTSGDTNVATVALANGADARGALYNITAVADGKTDITVTYQGKTSKIAVKVGGFQLDTTSKKMAPGQVYSVLAKNVPADQAGNVTLAYDSNIVDVVKVNDNYNGRGVLFNVTAKAIGDTEVKATYNNETESMAVNVVENTGKLTLDTASYTMPFGGTYTIGVKVEKNGRELSGEEVRAMITSGELVVTDSRTGSIVTTEVQTNGNVRVTGRQREGTTYVQFIVMQNGQRVTHASVGVTVQNGATAGGSSVRSISQW